MGKPKYVGKSLFLCHFVHHKSHGFFYSGRAETLTRLQAEGPGFESDLSEGFSSQPTASYYMGTGAVCRG